MINCIKTDPLQDILNDSNTTQAQEMHSINKINMSYIKTYFLLPLSSNHLSVLRLPVFISDLNSTVRIPGIRILSLRMCSTLRICCLWDQWMLDLFQLTTLSNRLGDTQRSRTLWYNHKTDVSVRISPLAFCGRSHASSLSLKGIYCYPNVFCSFYSKEEHVFVP